MLSSCECGRILLAGDEPTAICVAELQCRDFVHVERVVDVLAAVGHDGTSLTVGLAATRTRTGAPPDAGVSATPENCR